MKQCISDANSAGESVYQSIHIRNAREALDADNIDNQDGRARYKQDICK